MLARRTTLKLRNGEAIDMPRLVPSFSSKGFPFFKDKGTKKTLSETTHALELTNALLTDSFLVSAYDLHHGHLHKPHQYFAKSQVLFIDSGGYEVSPEYESAEPMQGPYQHKPFTSEDYRKVLRKLRKSLPIVVTNPDWELPGQGFEDQVLESQKFFNEFPQFTRNFLIKPSKTKKGEPRKQLLMEEILPHVGKLRAFDIVGVTEKELGKNILDRLKSLARLRAEMDRQKVNLPVHVWGGLDPVLTPLYFFAGAEIFDGVSWLRYAYHDGMAVYRDCFGIVNGDGIGTSFDHVRVNALFKNLSVLQRLTSSLRRFVDGMARDFSMFEWHQKEYENAYKVICTEVPDIGGA